MATNFVFSQLMQRPIRGESWREQGVSSLRVAREALIGGKSDTVSQSVENYIWEGQFVYRSYYPWLGYYLQDGAKRFGDDAVWTMLERVSAHFSSVGYPPLAVEVLNEITPSSSMIRVEESRSMIKNYSNNAQLPVAKWEPPLAAVLEQLRAQVAADDREGARTVLEHYHRALKPIHDALTDWTWLWMTLVADQYGETVMFDQLKGAGEKLRSAGLRRQASLPIEELVLQMAMAMRGHRSGPGEEGEIAIVEDMEKFVITFDACGSGGRMRRLGEIDQLPPRQEPRFSFGQVKTPSDASWGLTGVPYYCTHCAMWSEVMSTDLIGYPARITLFNPDGTKPCAWAIYKHPEEIPLKYFERIGRIRDPKRFNKLEIDVRVGDVGSATEE